MGATKALLQAKMMKALPQTTEKFKHFLVRKISPKGRPKGRPFFILIFQPAQKVHQIKGPCLAPPSQKHRL